MKIFAPIIDIFLPRRCLLCASGSELLCAACGSTCTKSPLGKFVFDANYHGAIFSYELTLRDLIKNAKFNNNYPQARLILELLRHELKDNLIFKRVKLFGPSVVTFVPTFWLKRSVRGIDLSAAGAKIIADYLGVPLVPLLKKAAHKPPQSSISNKHDRQKAVQNLFALTTVNYYDKILLIDDITTTGSTFLECKKTLKPISNNIICLALAKTP
jgi:predicted amidophosphoribosyltransferase